MQDGGELHSFLAKEPFHLALSAGYFGFYAHAGLLAGLVASDLAPITLSGSSAGALVGGLHAAGMEPAEVHDELAALERSDFWDPGIGLGLLRGRRMERRLEEILPVRRIEECRLPLAISTHALFGGGTRVYREGPLARLIRASCAIPPLFMPVRHDGRLLADGGIGDRLALAGAAHADRTLVFALPSRRGGDPRAGHTDDEARRFVVPDGLERLGPFRLDRGLETWQRARDFMISSLERPRTGDPIS